MDFDSFHYDDDQNYSNEQYSSSLMMSNPNKNFDQIHHQDSQNELETDDHSPENTNLMCGQKLLKMEEDQIQLIESQSQFNNLPVPSQQFNQNNYFINIINTQQNTLINNTNQLQSQQQNILLTNQKSYENFQNIVKAPETQIPMPTVNETSQQYDQVINVIQNYEQKQQQKQSQFNISAQLQDHNTNEFNSFNLDDNKEQQQQPPKLQKSTSLKKQQSQFKNANKFFISNFLNYLQCVVESTSPFYEYIMNIKKTGKANRKVDLFTLAHYRVLFLHLDRIQNFSRMNKSDIDLHSQVFMVPSQTSLWDDNIVQKINDVKTQICQYGKDYFQITSDKEIYQKIVSKEWDSSMEQGYLQWVSRIQKKIREMEKFEYIYRI